MENKKLLDQCLEAMQEFVAKVDKGEVHSTYTYNKFKDILNKSNSLGN